MIYASLLLFLLLFLIHFYDVENEGGKRRREKKVKNNCRKTHTWTDVTNEFVIEHEIYHLEFGLLCINAHRFLCECKC